ncbi:acyltransferase [Escherichia coli]|nr:acyltransferase [Escherichia coli]
MFGENVCIYDHDHRFDNRELLIREQGYTSSSVVIGNNVWIGSNSVILKGVSIGNNSVIAAGSVVFSDIPENTIMYAKKTNVYKAIV